jgi:zinc protease
MRRRPDIKPVDPGVIQEAAIASLSNGIPIFMIDAGTEEIVRIEFTFKAGDAFEYLPLLASTTNLMLTEGSTNYSALKINRQLDLYGVYYNLYCEKDRSGIVLYSMNRHLGDVIKLSSEIIFEPVFPEKEIRSLMKKRLRSYQVNREKVSVLASDRFFESIFGNHHPYGRTPVQDDFRRISPSVLHDFHSGHYRHDNMAMIVSGKIPGNMIDLLEKNFGNIKSEEVFIEDPGNFLSEQEERKIRVKKPGTIQSAIKIGSASINKTHPDYPALKIFNTILGGYFGSRLMKNLREEKGYTYGISSSVNSLNISGYKVISTEVSKKFTQNAIDEIYREIKLLQTSPVGKDELKMVKNYMLGDMVRMFDGPFAIADSFRSAWEYGLDNSYYYRFAEKIKSIESDEITSIAKTYYDIDSLYEITAG